MDTIGTEQSVLFSGVVRTVFGEIKCVLKEGVSLYICTQTHHLKFSFCLIRRLKFHSILQLTHSRPGNKKDNLNSDLKTRPGKTPKGPGHEEEERWRKKRWPQLKSRAHKDSNSSAFSSSAVSSPGLMDIGGLFCKYILSRESELLINFYSFLMLLFVFTRN